jgi:hypothetical protein
MFKGTCKKCGKSFEGRSNNQRYCLACKNTIIETLCDCGCGGMVPNSLCNPNPDNYIGKHGLGAREGHRVSEETRRKQSVSQLGEKGYWWGISRTEEYKQMLSLRMIQALSSLEIREKISRASRIRMSDPREREKQSKAIINYLLSDKGRNKSQIYKVGYFYSDKNKKNLWYRCSYELRAYKILETLSSVLSYIVEPLVIPYWFEGHWHNYLPDILITYIDNKKKLLEIKPKCKLEILPRYTSKYIDIVKKNWAKIAAAEIWAKETGIPYEVWTEYTIRDIEKFGFRRKAISEN